MQSEKPAALGKAVPAVRPAHMREAGLKLGLSDETISTAYVFFHRFFVSHSAADFDCSIMTMASLFLSAKAGEQQRKARDLINVFHAIEDGDGSNPMIISQRFWKRKDRLLEYESYLLRSLAFDVEVELPHRYLMNYLSALRAPRQLALVALGMLNDSFETTLCVHVSPSVVACAVIFLSAGTLEVQLPVSASPATDATSVSIGDRQHSHENSTDLHWCRAFGASPLEIEQACETIVEFYQQLEKPDETVE